jgi:hypothetical protein
MGRHGVLKLGGERSQLARQGRAEAADPLPGLEYLAAAKLSA